MLKLRNRKMSGEEWYKRFNKEVEKVNERLPELMKEYSKYPDKVPLYRRVGQELDLAARKASRLV